MPTSFEIGAARAFITSNKWSSTSCVTVICENNTTKGAVPQKERVTRSNISSCSRGGMCLIIGIEGRTSVRPIEVSQKVKFKKGKKVVFFSSTTGCRVFIRAQALVIARALSEHVFRHHSTR